MGIVFPSLILKCYHKLFFECHLISDQQAGSPCRLLLLSGGKASKSRQRLLVWLWWAAETTLNSRGVKAWAELAKGNIHLGNLLLASFIQAQADVCTYMYAHMSVCACIQPFMYSYMHACMYATHWQFVCTAVNITWRLPGFLLLEPNLPDLSLQITISQKKWQSLSEAQK